jgi:hypothetical protein
LPIYLNNVNRVNGENPRTNKMSLPSDELHKNEPITFLDFAGISIHDALIVQKVMRARTGRLQGLKVKAEDELRDIDLTLSIYITEEVRKTEPL